MNGGFQQSTGDNNMTDSQVQDYLAHWKRRTKEEKQRLKERFVRGNKLARICAEKLVEEYGARKVYLIGSLTDQEKIHPRTDIDLVVYDLKPEKYFRALADCYRCLEGKFELDLIPYEDANAFLREKLKEHGTILARRS